MNYRRKALLVATLLAYSVGSFAQSLSLKLNNVSVKQAMSEVRQKSGYSFVYEAKDIDTKKKVSVNASDLKQAVAQILQSQNVSYTIQGKSIVIKKGRPAQDSKPQSSQTIKIVGNIVDHNGEPIIGATVSEVGGKSLTVTDLDGNFTLEVGQGSDIQVSYIGYKNTVLKAKSNMNISLSNDEKLLDEVVVVGYGTQRKKLVTSAISAFKPNENTRLTNNPGDMLEGTVAGVTIAKTSGNLGSGLSFSVRGAASLNAGTSPLVVVDGIPLVSYDADINNMGESMSSLSMINTADIESIEILKDAASAAIYGSRATNGVVLITTKSGKKGKAKLDVNINMGISQFANRNGIKMANSEQYINVVNEGIDNYNRQNNYQPGSAKYRPHRVNPFGNLPDTDWLGLILRTAHTYNVDIALSGGGDATTFYIGGSVLSQEGVVRDNHLSKLSFKTNVKHRFSKWLEISANNNLVYSRNQRIPGSGAGTSVIGRSITQRPYDRPFKPNGDYYVGGTNELSYHNIVQILNEQTNHLDNLRFLGTLNATLYLAKNLTFKTSLSTDIAYTDDYLYYNERHPYGASVGTINEGSRIYKSYIIENYANYNNKIGDQFTYELMAGHSFQHTAYKKTAIEGRGYPSPSFDVTGVAAEIVSAGSSETAYAMDSYFGRANLAYKDRYIMNLTLRTDGSSKFAKAHRYGWFPSVSLGWNISQEDFWKMKSTDAKFRLSYGRTGNQEGIGIYAYQAMMAGGANYNMKSGIAMSAPGNQDLQWEKADQYNVGFDLGFFNGKINMIFDMYLKNTLNLLYNKPVSTLSGFTSIISNIGSMRNTGVEFTINGHFNIGKMKWTSSFNIAHNKNKLTKLLGNDDIITYGSLRAYKVGQEVGSWYLYNAVGIYQTDEEVPEGLYKTGVRAGDVKYEGDEDGRIDANDLRFIGSSNPKVSGGWNNTFTYKNFELNVMLSYKFGQKTYSVALQQSERIGGEYGLTEAAALGRWTGPGTSNTHPRAYTSFTNNYKYSTRHLQNGSFVRLRSLTFSYKFPRNLIAKVGLKNLRAYVQGDNLFIITAKDYRGYDPEIMNNTNPAYQGYDNYIVPQPRTLTFGLNATF